MREGLWNQICMANIHLMGSTTQSQGRWTYSCIHIATCWLNALISSTRQETAASQYLGTKFGVTVNLTTKFYAGLARVGIIYSWAHAKACAFYQWIPISGKQGWDSFKQRIEECSYHALNDADMRKDWEASFKGMTVHLHTSYWGAAAVTRSYCDW